MSRLWQEFVAPGPEAQQLPIEPSPWHRGRWVRIPKVHWDLILEFGARFDEASAARLDAFSKAADDNEMDYVYASQEELQSLIQFIETLAAQIERAEPLVLEATVEIPDTYTNEEHVRMLNAAAAVFREAIRSKQPFRAWSE